MPSKAGLLTLLLWIGITLAQPLNESNITTDSITTLDNATELTPIWSCSFETALKAYSEKEICNFNVDLLGRDSKEKSIEDYKRCRVISGYVAIRNFEFILRSILPNDDVNHISFPNLEIIRDFLVVYNFKSRDGHANLDRVFPKLRRIYGHNRFHHSALYISNYHASQEFGLSSLKEVCGPVMVRDSTDLCFRYSPTYWNLIHKHVDTDFFASITRFNQTGQVDSIGENATGVTALIQFNWKDKEDWHHYLGNAKMATVTVYTIDSVFYDVLANKLWSEKQSCNESLADALLLADLSQSEKQELRSRFMFIDKTLQKDSIKGSPYIDQVVGGKHQAGYYENTLANFDIRNIVTFPISKLSKTSINVTNYHFLWHHVYLIKFEICNSTLYTSCSYYQQFLFIPTLKATNPGFQSYNLFVAFLFVTILGILLFFLVIIKNYQNKDDGIVISPNPEYPRNWHMQFPLPEQNNIEDIPCEINRSRLLILEDNVLGKGEFGYVYQGYLLDYDIDNNRKLSVTCSCKGETTGQECLANHKPTHVAIKRLYNDNSRFDSDRFISEAKYMKTLKSNFLVKLIGVSTIEDPVLVVMECMSNGDLKHFLRKCYQEYILTHNQELLPCFETCVRIAIQIADGMHYLHSKKVIHRDLAARNCMVSSNLTVKVGDFGLSRDLYEKDYYRLQEETRLPLRWMAPESVRQMIFTQATDVWSYGVVLWEIMTFGEQPYKGMNDDAVRRIISDNIHLQKPSTAFKELWRVAKQCWHRKPSSRPNFMQITRQLYPYMVKDRQTFDSLSYYSLVKEDNCSQCHQFSLREFFTDTCFEIIKFTRHGYPNYRRGTNTSNSSAFTSGSVSASVTEARITKKRWLRFSNRRRSDRQKLHTRQTSIESIGSGTCSEITAFTNVSAGVDSTNGSPTTIPEELQLI